MTWRPATAGVAFDGSELLDGERWPAEIVLEAWERNELGERRIKATRRYELVDEDAD